MLRQGHFTSSQAAFYQDENENPDRNLSKFEIPINNNFVQLANDELNQFKGFLNRLLQMNQSALTNKISFAENLAFRLLGTIDWHKANFDELKQFIEPFLNSQYLNLNHLIFKENGKFLHLKQTEAHEAIHTWTAYRTKMNGLLIENPNMFSFNFSEEKREKKHFFWHKNKKIEGPFESILHFDDIDDHLKEVMFLYLIAKWSKDDSTLKFSTFFHYGLPRARARESTLPDNSLILAENFKDISASSGASSMIGTNDSNGSSCFSDFSSPSSSSSKIEDPNHHVRIVDDETKPPAVRFYTRPQKIQLRLNRTSSFMNNTNENSSNESSRNAQRPDLKYVNGGIIASGNVYFPKAKK